MEPLLKRLFPMPKELHRVIILLLLALIGLISVLGIQFLSSEKVIGVKPETGEFICSTTKALSPEQLSGQGRTSYDQGHFDEAIDCWQKAVATYHKLGNENEVVNNQINQAQAEQAQG